MDVSQIGELRTWAARLEERADSDELRAAAKAILMLTEEVEDLQARLVVAAAAATPAGEETEPVGRAEPAPSVARRRPARTTLLRRIKRAFGLE